MYINTVQCNDIKNTLIKFPAYTVYNIRYKRGLGPNVMITPFFPVEKCGKYRRNDKVLTTFLKKNSIQKSYIGKYVRQRAKE